MYVYMCIYMYIYMYMYVYSDRSYDLSQGGAVPAAWPRAVDSGVGG
jgi:hypothetical protein